MAPYIGITGFMSQTEVRAVLEVVPQDADHELMVGVLASSKTLADVTNKYPARYPRIRSVASIFDHDLRTLNLIHYATDDPSTLENQLFGLWHRGGDLLDGFQLNIAWPDPRQLDRIRKEIKIIVLQINDCAMAEVANDARALARKLDDYDGLITDILIDSSAGHGQPFDPIKASELLLAIRERHPLLDLGVAGGLSAQNLHLVEPLAKLIPDLNIDAEGRLRNPADDRLDLDAAREYVIAAFNLFKRG